MVVDYSLNDMTAKDFIVDMQAKGLVLPPFIIATGQGDERIAVELMKLGARDYIIKDTNFLDFLPSVIRRVVKEIENENKLKLAEEEVLLTKQTFIDIYNTVNEAIYILDENFVFLDVNKGAENMYLMTRNEFIGKTPANLSAPDKNDMQEIIDRLKRVFKTGISEKCEFWALRSNGEIFPKDVIVNKGKFFNKNVLIATARDVSERKKAEDALVKKVNELSYMNKFMVNREVRMADMKKEVNELLERLGEKKRYL